MFEKQREVSYNIEINALWDFLIHYNWGKLIKGYSVKEEKDKWIVLLENNDNSNVQIVELASDKKSYKIKIKITPKYNKHHSYDVISISLIKEENRTSIIMEYAYYPNSISEKIFAKILNREEHIFDEYSNVIFNEISGNLLKKIYG